MLNPTAMWARSAFLPTWARVVPPWCPCDRLRRTTDVCRIWHPTYGVIYDEGEVIKRGAYASSVQRAGPW